MIHQHYVQMFFIMIISGLLSTMNIWASDWSDIRLSLNDLYMTLLMTGWMFFLMGILDKILPINIFGMLLIVGSFYAIRKQLFIDQNQYLLGMIPHHSMAIMMSKRLLENDNSLTESERLFLKNLIKTQEDEIIWMKRQERYS